MPDRVNFDRMTLWLALSLMTGAAVLAVLWPLARRPNRLASASDIAIYRDQLEEVRRDRAAGQIGVGEAAAAEREVSRRLIAAADAGATDIGSAASNATTRRRRVAAVTVLVLLPIGAAGIYLGLGSPTLPDQPLAPRLAASRGGQSVESLIAQVEAHLERRPDDGRGWELIAPVYVRLGRFDDAVKARRSALRLNGETAEREAALGEALVFAANGVVTTEAKAAFDRAVALDAAHVQARYFIGLAAEQDGDRDRAAATWQALLADAPPDAPWIEFVRRALERVVDANADRRPSGPSEEQIAASSGLSNDQRNAMIRGMVERLSQRLERDGSDPEGWLRLVRSYMVLGEPDKARAAAGDARRALAGDPTKLRHFEDLVKALGLEG
jgi:cytochrome c-type biogenesis protein CcmH